ncbi:MAG: hypothetical protein N2645_14300 [Clostridia bacterium]|nr:hypothetical protein [Clostridia bacterium]
MLITYNGPTGDPIENPSINFLKDIIFNKAADYWAKGSGDSGIEIEGLDETLIFFYDEPYGFFIMRHPDYLVPYDESAEIRVVEHKVGGEPMRVPSCCYVSRERAYETISEFVTTKSIPSNVNWTDIYDIEFDHGFE